ncbi:pollen receptor-like kinase 3, partial [Asparagus officinalis]|uniref:pollen receptor-like kinase 3 n=1 Tax=Asparagus officinalis TaxID=4686 RepID=UPI00098E5CB1
MQTSNVSGTILLLFLLLPFSISDSPAEDAQSLIQFKSSFVVPDPDPLAAWSPASSPCNPKSLWPGVICDKNSITGLRLAGLKLSGASINVEPLRPLTALRSISLDNNALSGPIPAFSLLDSLKSIYLSNNKFSGDIPDDYFANMDHLKKFWVDGNALTGKIPSSISKAVTLIELQLQNNQFSGELPDISISSLTSFNVSGNTLTGKIPDELSKKFKAESFAGNPGNVLPPLAYLYRRDEKLVVSEYASKGNLLYILHGDRGPDHASLDWLTRLFLNPSLAPSVLFSFKSPESLLHHHVSPKSDVYCLGVLILEILTGKFPSQYLSDSARGGTDVVTWAVAAIKEGKEVELLDPNVSRTASD